MSELIDAPTIATPEDADIMAIRKATVAGLEKITLLQLKNYVGGGGAGGSFIGCRLRKSADQALSATTTTLLTWDTEDFDTSNFHDPVTNNDTITIPAGIAYVSLTLNLQRSSATGQLVGAIQHNGTNIALADTDTAGGDSVSLSTGPIAVAEGDVFKATGYVESASNINAAQATCFSLVGLG